MKPGFRTFLILLILSATSWQAGGLFAQAFPVLKFHKFYGRRGDDEARRIIKSNDGNLLIGGTTEAIDGRGRCTNVWVIKVNPEDGEMIWEREIGGSGCDELRDIITTPDSGVIFTGVAGSFVSHPEKGTGLDKGDYFIGKLDKNGNIRWIKTYGGLDVDQAFSIVEGPDDTYLISGASNSASFDVGTEHALTNLWVVKIDGDGKMRSSYSYGGNKHDWGQASAACDNGDVVHAGFTDSEDLDGTQHRSNGDGWLIRADRYGAVRWMKIFNGRFEDHFTGVIEDKDGRIILCGNFEDESKGKQFWFLKLTSDGRRIFENIFGGRQDEFSTSIRETGTGYIMSGYSKYRSLDNRYVLGGEDFWVIRLDHRGNVIWRKTYGGPDDERAYDILEYEPGVFFAVGVKYNDFEWKGTRDMKKDFWLVKLEESECEGVDVEVYTSLQDYTAYVGRSFKCRAIVEKGDNFLWDFGDGTVSKARDPNHTYKVPGVYEIKLTVFLNENCSVTYTVPELIMVW